MSYEPVYVRSILSSQYKRERNKCECVCVLSYRLTIHVCMCECIYVCMSVYMYIWEYICMCVCGCQCPGWNAVPRWAVRGYGGLSAAKDKTCRGRGPRAAWLVYRVGLNVHTHTHIDICRTYTFHIVKQIRSTDRCCIYSYVYLWW